MTSDPALDIRALTPALLPDWLAFFDRDAFADNPEWASCYCRCFQFPGSLEAWDAATAADNRAAMVARIACGEAEGLLAYADGAVIGWCQAARPATLCTLPLFLDVVPGDDTGCITCFVVAKPWRRRGVARSLLAAAEASFRGRGLAFAQAYPKLDPDSVALHFPGPLELYLEAGFEKIADLRRWKRVVVQKAL